MADYDLREHPLEPVADDAVVSPVARRTVGEMLRLMEGAMRNPLAAAIEMTGKLERLSDADLEGVQALGQAIAAWASSARQARRENRAQQQGRRG